MRRPSSYNSPFPPGAMSAIPVPPPPIPQQHFQQQLQQQQIPQQQVRGQKRPASTAGIPESKFSIAKKLSFPI
jgi:hypothetical protein